MERIGNRFVVALLGRSALCLCLSVGAPSSCSAELPSFVPPPLRVPPGFKVELAAAPPLVQYPMMACLDERGRLFIAETSGQNLDKEGLLEQRSRFIRMLEDTDGDGRFDKSTIFADRLVMPEGALWHRGSLFVLSSPYLWRFADTDDDGVADVREKLIGYMEFNGKANQHGAYLGPNGRLHFSGGIFGYDLTGSDGKHVAKGAAAGVFTCRVDGSDLEVFGNGGINPVEVAFTAGGELLTTCAIFDSVNGRHDALIHWVRGATAGPKDYQPPVLKQTGHRLPALSRWGQVAPSGLMRYRSHAFGEEYQDSFFSTHFNTATVVHTRLQRSGSTFRAIDEDFLTSSSRDFHPTDVLEDEDGSLLVVDTGGWFLISCPYSKVAKPEIQGAIYRVRKTGATSIRDARGSTMPWELATEADLADRLDDARPVVRDRAVDELARRGEVSVVALGNALSSPSPRKRRHAVWALSRIGDEQAMGLIRTALADSDPTVQQAAVRSSGVLRDRRAVGQLIELLGSDELPRRRAAATALGQIGDSAAVVPLLAALALGGDVHLQHALVYALIEIGDFESTLAGLAAVSPQVQHAALVALDQIDPSRLTQQHVAPLLQSDDAILRRAALAIVTAREGWSDQIISFLDGWVGANDDPAQVELAHAAILTFAGDVRVQQMIKRALASPATSDEVREELLVALGRLRPLPEAWIAPLNKLLKSQRDTWQLKVIACIAASGTTALNEQLGVLGRDPATSESVRLAAWLCLAEGGAALPREPFARLVQQVSAASDPLDRLTAARALARAALARDQLEQLVDLLPRMGSLELPALVEAIGRSSLIGQDPPLSLRFVRALDRSTATSALAPDQLERILQSLPGQVQVQAEAVRAKVRASDQEIIQHLQHVMRTLSDGDVERGRGVFFSNRAACSACHAVEGAGGNIGPDLSHIGKIRARSDLLEAILFPSASIVNSFETYAVATTDGRIVQGILQRADNRWLALRDAQRNEIVISRDDVETLQRQSGSIMPQGLVDDLSSDQLADLLAYLESLGVSH